MPGRADESANHCGRAAAASGRCLHVQLERARSRRRPLSWTVTSTLQRPATENSSPAPCQVPSAAFVSGDGRPRLSVGLLGSEHSQAHGGHRASAGGRCRSRRP